MENVPIHHSALSPKTHIQSPREAILKSRALSPLNPKDSYDRSLGDTIPTTASHFHPSQLESPPRHATQEAISTSIDASKSYLESYIVSSLNYSREDSSNHLEMAQSESRSRQTGISSGIDSRPAILDSPNPKARKQRKTTPVHEESETEEDLSLHQGAPAKSEPSSSKPGPKRRAPKKQANGSEATATPGQKARAPKVPKTERKTRKKAASQKSRRKSVPALPLLEGAPEAESEGEDPLLLVGNDQWVPVPWKPSPANVGIGYIKKEEEDAHVGWEGQEPRHGIDGDRTANSNDEESFNLPSSDERQDVRPEAEDSFLSAHPDADSSFVGMEIESDEDVSEFTVPVRLESPPPRRRRSSNVSQREETPAVNLTPAKSMSNLLPDDSENLAEVPDQITTRAIFRQLLQSTPARANGSKQPARPSTSRIAPMTPSGSHRRALTTSPYPSPRFTGQKLGSLSPEKGVGPSRGLHPKLGALYPARLVQAVEEEIGETTNRQDGAREQLELAARSSSAKSLTNLQPAGKPEHDDLDQEEGDGGPPIKHVTPHGKGDEDIQMEDETDEEELENSLRIERDLTEGLSDDDTYLTEGRLKALTPGRTSLSSVGEPARSLPHQNFKLFAESPSSDDGLIPLFDLAPVEPSFSNFAQSGRPADSVGKQEELLPSPELKQLAVSVQSEMGDQDTETESSDDEGPPVVEITSKEPMAAARAAAILKHWHQYSEEQAKLKLRRRRSSTASVNLSTPPAPARNQTSFMNLLVNRQTGSSASPIPQHMLQLAEAEVLATPPRSISSSSGQRDTQTLNSASQLRFNTPLHRAPSIPEIVINPASSRPSVDEAASQREAGRPWTKMDWKALEKCLLSERRRIAQRFGLQEKQVDVGEVDVDTVVKTFIDQNRLVGDDDEWDEEGEWDSDKIRRRCIALQVRHSKQPAGSIVVPGSPLVIPFTPLQSRQTTPVGSFVSELGAPSGSGHPLPSQRSISPIIPLSTSLLAPRYVHLYEEASAMAGLSSEEQGRRVSGDGTPARPAEPSVPSDGLSQEENARGPPPSRIPVPLTRIRRPSASAMGSNEIEASLPPTPACPTSPGTLPVQATPSTASRVLGFLGLRGILRGNSKTAPTPTPAQKRGKPRVPSPPPNPIPTRSSFSHSEMVATPKIQTDAVPNTSRALNRSASPMPVAQGIVPNTSHTLNRSASPMSVAQVIIPMSKSKEDLNHIEPTPPRPSPRIPHPKELVALHPVPPKPSVPRTTQPRRSSGGSVKDLVKTFENLESQNAPKQQGPRNNHLNHRRFGSGPSLRRVPSNLSTCSVISADSLDPDRSMDESSVSFSCTPEPPHSTPGQSPA
ncbi:hypothetical protein FRC00_001378 [Tulasnella sp. 408]|nr:hypothetical protein FRC00_001378 [Tulasnella sp. 408]